MILFGGTGLLGTEVRRAMDAEGYDVLAIARNVERIRGVSVDLSASEPAQVLFWSELLEGAITPQGTVDAIVNLATSKGSDGRDSCDVAAVKALCAARDAVLVRDGRAPLTFHIGSVSEYRPVVVAGSYAADKRSARLAASAGKVSCIVTLGPVMRSGALSSNSLRIRNVLRWMPSLRSNAFLETFEPFDLGRAIVHLMNDRTPLMPTEEIRLVGTRITWGEYLRLGAPETSAPSTLHRHLWWSMRHLQRSRRAWLSRIGSIAAAAAEPETNYYTVVKHSGTTLDVSDLRGA